MSIRDVVVTILFVGVLPYALTHPWVGIGLWTWISIMNPHRLGWGFAYDAPFAAVAAGVTLVALFVTKDRVKLDANVIVVALLLFFAWTCLTTYAAIDRPDSVEQLNKVFKIQLMTLVAIAVLQERRHLRMFIWVNALSLGFFGVKGGAFTLITGGGERVWGPPGGFIEGNNELALALIMAIPLMYYLRFTSTNKWARMALLGTLILSAVSALGTYSRGALLAIVAMSAVLWWRSPHKAATLIPIVVLGAAMLAFMPENWFARMHTIQDYQSDGSAMGRIEAWQTMVAIANSRLLGAGFAAYSQSIFNAYAPGEWPARAAHSIYLQVVGEHGWIGFALFMSIWILGWRLAARIRQQAGRGSAINEYAVLAAMIQVSFVGYAVGGAFLSLAYFDLPYNLLVMLIVAQRLASAPAASGAPAAVDRLARRGNRGFPVPARREAIQRTPGKTR